MSMDSILTEKKFSQYQKDNDLFMRDLASLAGIREQALDLSLIHISEKKVLPNVMPTKKNLTLF